MSAVQTESQRKVVLSALNKDCKVAKNNVKGGIIVWVKEKTYTFKWDRDAKKWV